MEFNKRKVKVYLVCGKASSGKDTTSNLIKDFYKEKDVIELKLSYYIKDYAMRMTGWDGSEETKPRELLQQIGTELMRDKIDPLFSVKRMVQDINFFSYFYDIIVISDCRFKEEVDNLKKAFDDVLVIRINRPNFNNNLTLEQQQHRTEIDLDDYDKYDYILENDGSLEQFKDKVEKMLGDIENEC